MKIKVVHYQNTESDRFLKIEPILHHIYRCASEHRLSCEHCRSVAQLMEEIGFVRDKEAENKTK